MISSLFNNIFIIFEAPLYTNIAEHFASLKVKFDIDLEIKPIMNDEEKIAEHKLVSSIISLKKKISFSN